MNEDKLFLDFSSNTEINNEYNWDKIYKVGLRDQFETLNIPVDYESFVAHTLARPGVNVGISFPNFERTTATADGKNKWFNIAVRVPLERMPYDLVMMGDLGEYTPKNKSVVQRFLKVKGFTILDSGAATCGERKVRCDVYTRLDHREGWYNDGIITKYLSDEDAKQTVFTIDFLNQLNGLYVVDDPSSVLRRLDKWEKYLESKTCVMETDLEDCYSVDEGFELLYGYHKNDCTEEEKELQIKHLNIKDKNGVWSTKELKGSEKVPLFHMTHDFLKKDLESDSEILKKFERFTSNRSLLISGKHHAKTDPKDKRPEYPNSTQLRETRISSKVDLEYIPNQAKIDRIVVEGEREIVNKSASIEKDKKQELVTLLDHFSKGKLVGLIEDYRAAQEDQVEPECREKMEADVEKELDRLNLSIDKLREEIDHQRIIKADAEKNLEVETPKYADSNKKLKTLTQKLVSMIDSEKGKISEELAKLKKANSSIETQIQILKKHVNDSDKEIVTLTEKLSQTEKERDAVDSKFPLASYVTPAVEPLVSQFRKERLAEKEKDLFLELNPRYEIMKETSLNEIKAHTSREVDEVMYNETVARAHVFFRLDMDSYDEPENIMRNVKEKVDRNTLFLYKDPSGDRAIINRQKQALNNLRKGYVMNPFLATALFNRSSIGNRSSADIDKFFSNRLNEKQKDAVRKAVTSNGMFLIRGPPGTGKTEVIAEITVQLVNRGKKVLIASENHKAVDNAFQRLPELPILRRVRLFGGFASKREETNQFSVAKLTQNFYSDIAKRLENEVDKTSNSQSYAGNLEQMINKLRYRSVELGHLEDAANKELETIKDVEKEIDSLREKINRDLDDNSEFEIEISDIKRTIEAIENIEEEIFDKCTSRHNVEYNGNRMSQETFRALYALRKTEIRKEFRTIEENRELFDLLRFKAEAKNDTERKARGMDILSVQERLSINVFEFKMARVFPDGIPDLDTVIELKEQVDDEVQKVVDHLKHEISDLRSDCNDVTRNNQKLRSLEKELDELRKGPAVTAYETERLDLNSDIMGILSDNNIIGVFKTPLEGIKFIEDEMGRIKRAASSGLSEELKNAYSKMSNYLREEEVVARDEEALNEDLLGFANVIGLTCTTRDNIKTDAGEIDLKRINLDVVIVDEVSKVSFLEVLYPILYGKTVILVGDDKQLPPTYQTNVLKEDMGRYDSSKVNPDLEAEFQRMYEYSFFKELYDSLPECNKVMLTVQYRMHPDIMAADNIFYDGRLTYGGAEGNREHYLEIKGNGNKRLITRNSHLVFIDVRGEEIRGNFGGTSYTNPQEIEVIIKLLKKLESGCTKDRYGKDIGRREAGKEDTRLSLGVICGYSDQAKSIRNKLRGYKLQSFNRNDDEQFMVDTVDNFQGDERDIIILSLVRSKPDRSFMTKFNRINVAVSRARCLLVIVGDAKSFSNLNVELDGKRDYVYRRIVDMTRGRGLVTAKDVLGE